MNYKCPYSKGDRCEACEVLKIFCDGENFVNCEQYLITRKKEELKSALKRRFGIEKETQ